MKNKGILVVLVVLVAAAIGAGAYYAFNSGKIGATQATNAPAAPAETPAAEGSAPVVAPDEMFLGQADAPVTIVEYFSLGCPHCKHFHEEILPQLKADYLDTGKARIVFRDFPLDGVALAAAQLTRCVSPMAYFAMVDTLFAQQTNWHVKDGAPVIANIAKGAGMDQAAFDACLANQPLREKIANGAKQGQETYGVDATPTFFINGKKLSGVGEYAPFKEAVEAALAGK
ncbi:MAG TPA: DsbA family protein [Dongiaceae bacterium]|nr:DsbA family protein [Dongiaceae bacterium]